MEPLTNEQAIERLKSDRKKYVERLKDGHVEVLASIEFIDNILKRLVPGYVPEP